MPGCAGLCRTTPSMAAQRRTDALLSPVGDLVTLPTFCLSRHRGSCHDASATLVPRTAEGAHTCITVLGARLRPGNSWLSWTAGHRLGHFGQVSMRANLIWSSLSLSTISEWRLAPIRSIQRSFSQEDPRRVSIISVAVPTY
jgi:hypothetical protein